MFLSSKFGSRISLLILYSLKIISYEGEKLPTKTYKVKSNVFFYNLEVGKKREICI